MITTSLSSSSSTSPSEVGKTRLEADRVLFNLGMEGSRQASKVDGRGAVVMAEATGNKAWGASEVKGGTSEMGGACSSKRGAARSEEVQEGAQELGKSSA